MKIAMLTDTLHIGGGTEYIYQIARCQPENEFILLCKGGDQATKFQSLPNLTVDNSGYSARKIKRYRPDIIHCNHMKPLLRLYLDSFVAKLNIPVINTIHGVHLHKYEFLDSLKSKLSYPFRLSLERKLYNHANMNICLTNSDRNFLVDLCGIQNCTIIPNGIDFTRLENQEKTDRLIDLKRNFSFAFMTIGRFVFVKGYDILIEAIILSQEKLRASNAGFILIGDGPEYKKITDLAVRGKVDDIVCFVGELQDAFSFLQLADVFVLPSRWEGQPLVLLEAGFMKLPVIGADTYGINSVLKHGKTGTLFNVGDPRALAEVIMLHCQADFNSLGERLHNEVVGNYGIELMSRRLKDVYKGVLIAD